MTRALFLDCFSGISGNMFFGALLDVGCDETAWRAALSKLGLESVEVTLEGVSKRGVQARYGDVKHPEQHTHRGLSDVMAIIEGAELGEAVTARARRIFTRLAEAEAEVHGATVEEVHFHEVGAVDAIVDVVSAAWLLEELDVERVLCSPIRTGRGLVKCAHGMMPIPAPATALLLRGAPTYQGDEDGEFTTPTGAAIVAACVDAFGPQPAMRVDATGWGAGTREAPWPNCLRVLTGELEELPEGVDRVEETVVEIDAHVDDMSGEALGFLAEELMRGPAVDVLVIPAQGKKGRPAQIIRVLTMPESEAEALDVLFAHSTTLGARVRRERRVRLEREEVTVQTSLGPVRAKRTEDRGETRLRPEYDDLAALARESGTSFEEARKAFEMAAKAS
jgi:uncharacterized protein (TIGR00299 family) protein